MKSGLTLTERRAKRRYTALHEHVTLKKKKIYKVWLISGSQSFCVAQFTYAYKSEAKWTQDQLAIAIDNIIKENQP